MKQQHQAAYTRWLAAEIPAAIDDPRRSNAGFSGVAKMNTDQNLVLPPAEVEAFVANLKMYL